MLFPETALSTVTLWRLCRGFRPYHVATQKECPLGLGHSSISGAKSPWPSNRSVLEANLRIQEDNLASPPGNLRRSRPASRKAVRPGGIRAVAVGPRGWAHLRARSRPPVNAVAGPSERARTRTPESTPIRSLPKVKAATLRRASKSPIQTAPAERPATPRLPGFVEVLHLAPAGRHADGVDFASVRCWGGLTLTTALREGSFFSSF
jgi:hypothetical protein